MDNTEMPRICALLGLQVNEPFAIASDNSKEIFKITSKGQIIDSRGRSIAAQQLLDILNNQLSIVHLPVLSRNEKDICKMLHAAYITKDCCQTDVVKLWDSEPDHIDDQFCQNGYAKLIATVDKTLFPSVQYGDCIFVDQ